MATTQRVLVMPVRTTGPGVSLLNGVLTGAIAGLIGAVASAPLRRLAGVTDRSLVNGITIVFGAIVLWTLLGAVHAGLQGNDRLSRQAPQLLLAIAAGVALLLTVVVYGALAGYARRLPSLAEPLALLVVLGGAALFITLNRVMPQTVVRFAAPAGLIAAVAAAVLVSALDRAPAVHYTLSALPAAAAAPSGSGAAGGAGTTPATTGAALHFTVSNESEAAFTVNEKLTRLPAPSDAVGKTNSVTGDLYLLAGSGLSTTSPSTFSVDLSTLATDSSMRDGFIKNQTLQVNQYPLATYTVTGIDGFPATYKEGDEVKVTVNGTMTIHGTAKPVVWTGTARYAAGRLEAVLSSEITMTEFGMTPPSVPVVQSVDDKVHLDMHLVATQPSA